MSLVDNCYYGAAFPFHRALLVADYPSHGVVGRSCNQNEMIDRFVFEQLSTSVVSAANGLHERMNTVHTLNETPFTLRRPFFSSVVGWERDGNPFGPAFFNKPVTNNRQSQQGTAHEEN